MYKSGSMYEKVLEEIIDKYYHEVSKLQEELSEIKAGIRYILSCPDDEYIQGHLKKLLSDDVFQETTVAKADEFEAVQDSTGYVSLLDGEGAVRLSMDCEAWNQFISNAIIKRGFF